MPDPILLIVGAVIGTAILLAIALVAGFWAGLQVGWRGQVPLSDELASLKLERERWLSNLSALNEKMEQSHELSEVVGLLAQSAHSSISPDLFRAIDSMIQTTRTLALELRSLQEAQQAVGENQETMKVRGDGPPPGDSPLLAPQHSLRIKADEETADPALTKDEMWEVTGQHCLADSSTELETKRYPYDCLQFLARWDYQQSLPDPDEYTSVRCHDISVTGVSFLWPEMPTFSRAIILIGPTDSPIYMVIEVSQYKSVYKHGSVCYLVGGRFVNRLERATEDWQKAEAVLCS
jgi:hypothetical protein